MEMLEFPVFVKVKVCDTVVFRAVRGKVALPISVAVAGDETAKASLVADTVFAPMVKDAVSMSALFAVVTTRSGKAAIPVERVELNLVPVRPDPRSFIVTRLLAWARFCPVSFTCTEGAGERIALTAEGPGCCTKARP